MVPRRLAVLSRTQNCFLIYGVWRSLVAHLLWEQRVQGSNPCTPTNNGGLAQLGERLLCKQNVIGSIPVTSTIYVNAGSLTVTDTTGVMSPTAARFDSSIDTIYGPFVYRLGHLVFNQERGVQLP